MKNITWLFLPLLIFIQTQTANAVDNRPVLVVTGMAKEVQIADGEGIITVFSAANGQQLRATLKQFDFTKVRAVVSFGVGGGLHPNLKPGDLTIATKVITETKEWPTSPEIMYALTSRFSGYAMPVKAVTAYAHDRVDTETNAELRTRTGADTVDTESHVAAEFAAAHNLPFAVIRAISDGADSKLPPAALIPLLPNGHPNIGAILKSIFEDPSQIGDLIRTATNAEKGFSTLRKVRRVTDSHDLAGAPLDAEDYADQLPDRTTKPTMPTNKAEKVAAFAFPPGHVGISKSGRIFMDAGFQDSQATIKVIELKNGQQVPFPEAKFQAQFKSVHGVTVDHADRLWVLDHRKNGFLGKPKLYGYDINTGKEIENYEFPAKIAGLGSMLNDVVVDPVREKLYISEPGPVFGNAGIIVFDIKTRTSRRLLDRHPSVSAANYRIYVEGQPFTVLGLVHPKFGIDGLAIDPTNTWLYYSAFNSGELHRIDLNTVNDAKLTAQQVASQVRKVANITMTDGIHVDAQQRVYMSDVEHSALVRLNTDGKLETLLKDPEFRWPTGFTASPDGYLYVSCNAIHQVTLKSRKKILDLGPYYLYRFKAD